MAEEQSLGRYEEEGLGTKLVAKAQRNPFLVLGLTGLVATLAVGAYNFKKRSKDFHISMFFVQLRVVAQSVVIGSLTVGMTYSMLQEFVFKEKKPKIQGN